MARIAFFIRTNYVKLSSQILRFGISGILAFLVDAMVLHWAMQIGTGFYLGRAISFFLAATFTWLFNRKITFGNVTPTQSIWREWTTYLAAMLLGGVVNYLVSAWLYREFELVSQWPVLAVAAGSIAGLIFNFSAAKFVVFRHR